MDNVDGSLFCDGCAWDVSMVESTPGGGAPAPAASRVSGMAAAPAGSRVSGIAAAPASRVSGMSSPASGLTAAPASGLGMAEPAPLADEFGMAEPAPVDAEMPMDMSGSSGSMSGSMSMEAATADAGEVAELTDLGMGDVSADVGEVQLEMDAPPPSTAGLTDAPPPSAAGLADAPPASTVGFADFPPPSAAGLMDAAPPPSAAGFMDAPPASGVRQPSALRPPTQMKPPAAPAATVVRLFPCAMAKLVVVKGVKAQAEFPIYEGQNIIGRFDEAPVDIDLTDQEPAENPRASRQHAAVTYENGSLVIEDLNSSNGTFVNRIRVNPGEKKPVRNGDYIQTGQVLLQVKA